MRISIYPPECLNEIGNRSNQEDSVYPEFGQATDKSRFFMVCDGMGGHEHGEVASQAVCQALADHINSHWDREYFSDDIFHDALHATMCEINKLDDDSVRKPGTTMTFLCLHRGGVMGAHIGDSRIYHIRPSEQRILYKSRDHSLVYDLFLAGEITKDEMSTFNKKNVLTRAILPNMEREPKADVVHITDVLPDDIFILCSDGMLEKINDLELINLLCSGCNKENSLRKLITKTVDNNDNHSAYIIYIKDVLREDNDRFLKDDELSTRSNAILFELPVKMKNMSFISYIKKIISNIRCHKVM